MKDQNDEPWYHIKDVLLYASKEIIGGFEEISNILIGKTKFKTESKKDE